MRAVKNKNFECNKDVMERILYDSRNLCKEIRSDNEANIEMYIGFMGYILAHIMFSRGNQREQFEDSVKKVSGFFETTIDIFHPMTPKNFENYYYKKMFSNFVRTFSKQFKKYTGKSTIDIDYIKKNIFPVVKRILSFATISFFWDGLDEALIDLSCLDEDYFLDEIMDKIKLGYQLEELRKVNNNHADRHLE